MPKTSPAAMKLSEPEVKQKLEMLNGWKLEKGKLHKEFRFKSFAEALSFINKVGEIAESLNHHPEIFNVYNKVILEIETHDVGGLTLLDFSFANQVDSLE